MIEMVRDICREIPKTMRVTNILEDSRAIASMASVSLRQKTKTATIRHDMHKLSKGRSMYLLLRPDKRLGQLVAVSR